MLPAAIGLLLAGFGFTFFSVTVGDLDILIDAVGFLLVFNGVGALRKANKGLFGGTAPVCLLLVVVACLQLFLPFGAMRVILLEARAALEAILYLLLARSMGRALQENQHVLSLVVRGAFLLNAFGTLMWGALSFFSPLVALSFGDIFMLLFHLALIGVLGYLLLSVPLAGSGARIASYAAGLAKKQRKKAEAPDGEAPAATATTEISGETLAPPDTEGGPPASPANSADEAAEAAPAFEAPAEDGAPAAEAGAVDDT